MFVRCLDEFIGRVVKLVNGVEDTRESELIQHKEYEIYLTPRQEGRYDYYVHKYGKEIRRLQDISEFSKDLALKAIKEWIDEQYDSTR